VRKKGSTASVNKAVVKKDIKPEIKPFNKELEDKIKKLLMIADKSRVLNNPRHKDMNQDFIVIQNNIETTRNFNLKVMKVFELSKYIKEVKTEQLGKGKMMSTVVTSIGHGNRWNESLGSCTTDEVKSKREDNSRFVHDMVAIAETRALKRAVEEYVGLPIINMVIKKLFGGYQTYQNCNQIKNTDYEDSIEVDFKKVK
jgi:hypothetical protein